MLFIWNSHRVDDDLSGQQDPFSHILCVCIYVFLISSRISMHTNLSSNNKFQVKEMEKNKQNDMAHTHKKNSRAQKRIICACCFLFMVTDQDIQISIAYIYVAQFVIIESIFFP